MNDPEAEKTPSLATAKIEVWLAGVLMMLAFAVGFLLHSVTSEPSAPAQQPITGLPAEIVPAGPLTGSQLQGDLPPGHPEFAPGQTGAGIPEASPTKDRGNKDKGNSNDESTP